MKRISILLILMTLCIGCEKAYENQEDLNKIEIGMDMTDVELIMRNDAMEYESKYDADSIITKLYEAPIGAAGDFEIIYSKKDSTVLRINYGN